jgi:hypothetical protein
MAEVHQRKTPDLLKEQREKWTALMRFKNEIFNWNPNKVYI